MWLKMKKNYPGNNKPMPGLERCSFQQDREYDLPDDTAKKLIKTGYASKTTAPWERGVNRPMLKVEQIKNEITKLQTWLAAKNASLQFARKIALTIPIHEKNIEAGKKQLAKMFFCLEKFAKENEIILDSAKAKAETAANTNNGQGKTDGNPEEKKTDGAEPEQNDDNAPGQTTDSGQTEERLQD